MVTQTILIYFISKSGNDYVGDSTKNCKISSI